MKTLKYLLVITLPLTAILAFTQTGFWTYFPLIYAFVIIPSLELLFRPDEKNLSKAEEEVIKVDKIYDYLLYSIVPIQYGLLVFFVFSLYQTDLTTSDYAGRILSMGLLCGVLGINVAHELGHRNTKHEQFLSKLLLLSSLYMHFFIEHNRGHHKNVSTPDDSASARKNEVLYFFWFRSVIGGYISAWHLEKERLDKKGKSFWSFNNEMLVFQLVQIGFALVFLFVFNWQIMLAWILAATFGFLLLETVNYIEHYGLSRQKVNEKHYERVMPEHSWNSNHIVGRLLLFELSRHSDHHYKASRKYQILQHHDNSPQMPTGYPGMMVLSLFPPVWFWVMNPKVKKIQGQKFEYETSYA